MRAGGRYWRSGMRTKRPNRLKTRISRREEKKEKMKQRIQGKKAKARQMVELTAS